MLLTEFLALNAALLIIFVLIEPAAPSADTSACRLSSLLFFLGALNGTYLFSRALFDQISYEVQQGWYLHETRVQIVKRTGSAALLLLLLTWMLEFPGRNEVVVYFLLIFSALSLFFRLLAGYLLRYLHTLGFNRRNIVIVGGGEQASRFIKHLEHNRELGYRLQGFIGDGVVSADAGRIIEPVCNVSGFEAYLRANIVDEVAIFLSPGSHFQEIKRLQEICRKHGVLVSYASSLMQIDDGLPMRFFMQEIDGQIHVTMEPGRVLGWKTLIKRIVDVIGAGTLLTLLLPVFLVVAVLVKVTSSGPVIFRQVRIGLNKRPFTLYKFRTMQVDAEELIDDLEQYNEVSGPVFKVRNDPRLTPIGSFLRKYSLDELPQFANVLFGDMSLVGPRPLPLRDYKGFYKDVHRRRFSVRPGITCTWQIKGRQRVDFEQWMQLDLEYIDNWSLALDLKILVMTVPAIFRRSGTGW